MRRNKKSRFSGTPGDMRTNDRQRRRKFDDVHGGETAFLDQLTGRTVRMAAVSHSSPKRFDRCLNVPEHGSSRCGHVLNEKQSAAGLKHTENLAHCPLLINHTAKYQSADGEIDAGGFDWQLFRGARKQVDVHSESLGFLPEMLAHIRVRLDANPSNVFRRQVPQIGSCARTDFQDCAGEAGKQSRFIQYKVMVGLMATSRHEPGKEPQSKGTGTSTNSSPGEFAFLRRLIQSPVYSADGRVLTVRKTTMQPRGGVA